MSPSPSSNCSIVFGAAKTTADNAFADPFAFAGRDRKYAAGLRTVTLTAINFQ
jgi:hypothetical protein